MARKRKTKNQPPSQNRNTGGQTCSSTERNFQGYTDSNSDDIEGARFNGETISKNQRATTSQRIPSSTKPDLQGHNNSHYNLRKTTVGPQTRSQTKRYREEKKKPSQNETIQTYHSATKETSIDNNSRTTKKLKPNSTEVVTEYYFHGHYTPVLDEEKKKPSQIETRQTYRSATKEISVDNNSRTTKKLKPNSTEVVTEYNFPEKYALVPDLLEDIPHTSQSDLNLHRPYLERPQSNHIGPEEVPTGSFRKPEALEEDNNPENSLNDLEGGILNYEEQKASASSSYPLEKNDHGDWNNETVLNSHMPEKDLDEENKIIEALDKIHSQALPFTEKIENFTELEDSNQHYYIDESLSRLVKKLDYMDDDVGENERLIEKRKEVYKFIFSLVRALDKKVEQNKTQQNITHTDVTDF